MGKSVGSALELRQTSAPANPASGSTLVYTKSDNKVYAKSSAGVETLVGPISAEPPITGGTNSQYWRGDKSFQTLDLAAMSNTWVKKSVRMASTTNFVIATGGVATAVDGLTPVLGDRVLLKNQTLPAENGIYVVNAGAWTRAPAADTALEIAGAYVSVYSGTQGGQVWANRFKSTDTLGTTSMPWYVVIDDSDARLTNARTPTGTAGGSLAGTFPNPTLAAGAVNSTEINAAIKDAAAGTASLRTLGAGATQAAAGNHTHTAAALGFVDLTTAQTVNGAKTFGTIPLVTPANNQVVSLTSNAGANFYADDVHVWNDKARFSQPVYEDSPDGTTWTTRSSALAAVLFDGRGSASSLAINDAIRWQRFTWNNNINAPYNQIRRAILICNYINANAYTVTATFESSVDGATWTGRSTATTPSQANGVFLFPLADNGPDGYYRVTLQFIGGTTGGAQTASISGLQLQSARIDTGSTTTVEFPYDWDYQRQIKAKNHWFPITNNVYDLGATTFKWRKIYATDIDTTNVPTVGGTAVSMPGHTHVLSDLPDAWTKRSVKAATTANITLSGTQTIDTIALVAGDRVLVKNQTTTSQNGIYIVAAGAWTRATDADVSSELAAAVVAVDYGSQLGTHWGVFWSAGYVIGTNAMVWYQILDSSMIGAANGVASLNASGKMLTGQIGTGVSNATKYLAGDGNWTTFPASMPPSGTAGGVLTGTYPNPGLDVDSVGAAQIAAGAVGSSEVAAALKDGNAASATMRSLGTLPLQAAAGNHSHLAISGWRNDVKAATTANITLSGTQTIDGIPLNVGDRVLVKNQTTLSENGIWVVAASAWGRDTVNVAGVMVSTLSGTVNFGRYWTNTFSWVGTIGTDPMTWFEVTNEGNLVNQLALPAPQTFLDARYPARSDIPILGPNIVHNSVPVIDNSYWQCGGTMTRFTEDGTTYIGAPTGTYTYFNADGALGKYYAARFTVKGTPGTTFNAANTDNSVGAFASTGTYTIPASGYLTVIMSATATAGGTSLLAGVQNPSAVVKITNGYIAQVAGPGGMPDYSTPLDSGWRAVGNAGEPPFVNSWVNYGLGYPSASFRKIGNRVTLKGLIKSGSMAQHAFVLPAGYCPPNAEITHLPDASNNAFGTIYIDASSRVIPDAGSNSWVSLNGISFLVD